MRVTVVYVGRHVSSPRAVSPRARRRSGTGCCRRHSRRRERSAAPCTERHRNRHEHRDTSKAQCHVKRRRRVRRPELAPGTTGWNRTDRVQFVRQDGIRVARGKRCALTLTDRGDLMKVDGHANPHAPPEKVVSARSWEHEQW